MSSREEIRTGLEQRLKNLQEETKKYEDLKKTYIQKTEQMGKVVKEAMAASNQ